MVDRYVAHVMRWDADRDGRVTEADVDRQYPSDQLFPAVAIGRDKLQPPREGWTAASRQEHFSTIYAEMKEAAFAKSDDAPYPDPAPAFRLVAASNDWWKQWFEDTTPTIDHLAGYSGLASIHIGGIDSQSPGARQFAFAQQRIKAGIFARAPRLVFHKSRGYSLRTDDGADGRWGQALPVERHRRNTFGRVTRANREVPDEQSLGRDTHLTLAQAVHLSEIVFPPNVRSSAP
jgi:hypothetical protein